MMNATRIVLVAVFAIFSTAVHAQGFICSPSNAVGVSGIGDGCTTMGAEYVFPDVGAFRSLFTPACNNHDKCYSTLGTTYSQCDGNFINEMTTACNNQFNSLLQPVERATCKNTANEYYAAVKAWGSSVNPLPSIQQDALNRSIKMLDDIYNDRCLTTPEATTLFSSGLINTINNAFISQAGRSPTVYEFFYAVNDLDVIYNYDKWVQTLMRKAADVRSAKLPSVAVQMSQTTTVANIKLTSPTAYTNYLWKLSDGLVNQVQNGPTSVNFDIQQQNATGTRTVLGFVRAIDATTGVRNAAIVNVTVTQPAQSCLRITKNGPCEN